MNKLIIAAATAAVVAAAMTTNVDTAEAGLLRRLLHRHDHHHHLFGRRVLILPPVVAAPIIAAPVMRQPAMPVAPQPSPQPVSYTDGKGGVYDPAGLAWTDGQNQCWTGRQPWTFRNGAWSYGNSPWRQTNGAWGTNAPNPPTSVDCQSIPAFAQARPATQSVERVVEAPEPSAPVSDYSVAGASVCKKYFANVGQTVTIPCDK